MNNRLAKILAAIIARTFAEDISENITFGDISVRCSAANGNYIFVNGFYRIA